MAGWCWESRDRAIAVYALAQYIFMCLPSCGPMIISQEHPFSECNRLVLLIDFWICQTIVKINGKFQNMFNPGKCKIHILRLLLTTLLYCHLTIFLLHFEYCNYNYSFMSVSKNPFYFCFRLAFLKVTLRQFRFLVPISIEWAGSIVCRNLLQKLLPWLQN